MNAYFQTQPISDLRQSIVYLYTDMPVGLIDYSLRNAVIRFARMSGAVRRTIHFDGQKGLNEYHIELEDGHRIHKVHQVRVDGCCLEKACSECKCNKNQFKYHSGLLTICDFTGCKVEVDVTAIPTNETCDIDEDIAQQWGDVIASGANAKLMMSPDKRWNNPAFARQEEIAFLRGVEEAELYTRRGSLTPKIWHAPQSKINYGGCCAQTVIA